MKTSKKLFALALSGVMLFTPVTNVLASAKAVMTTQYVNCINMRCPTSGPAPHDYCSSCNKYACRICNYGHKDYCINYGVKY